MNDYLKLVELQGREIALAQSEGKEFFLDLPDEWYEPLPNYCCQKGHASRRYLKSEKEGCLCLACGKHVVMLPQKYDEATLRNALGIQNVI